MATHKRLIVPLVGLVASALWLLSSPAWAQQTLKIGELAALTGPLGPYGTPVHNARVLAIDEINARGGILVGGTRYKLELAFLDAGPPGQAIGVFERLVTVDKVNIVLDGLFSSIQYALGPILKGKNVLVLWSGGNDPGTTVGVPYAFRNHFDGGKPFMKVTEQFLKKMGVKRVATYGTTGHSEFKAFVEEYLPKVPGIEVVATEWHRFGEQDFFPILTKLKGLRPDAVITHTIATDLLNMVKQAREIGLYPGTLWLNQSAMGPLMIDEPLRMVLEGTYESLQASMGATTEPPAKSRRFFQAYAKRFGEKGFGPWAESGSDSVYIVAKALERAGTVADVPKIAETMYQLTREDVPDLLLDYKAGKLFDKDGQAYPKIVFTQWKGGKAVPVFSDFGL
jgi:branched-chain amino acid transport system substrate-binding protein